MRRIFTCFFIITFSIGCGEIDRQAPIMSESIVMNTIKSDKHAPTHENGFNTCAEEFAVISSVVGYFQSTHRNSLYTTAHISNYQQEHEYTNDLKQMTFTKDDPCKQIQVAFSGHFNNHHYIKLNLLKLNIQNNLVNNKSSKITDFFRSYLLITNDLMPDNISSLPDHNLEVSISCPSAMTVSCFPEEKECDSNKALKIKLSDEACTIQGSNQVFALYPNGQVIINFKGTITKTMTLENGVDELAVKFNNIEWR